ncbi:ABC transporter permease [Methylobacterium sp. NEAU 140]|uniref:ABC transporter permease n=1 Tax=Methylobacterium sp. NEAU 140 TaxID=3064945 RepID=UPI0027341916|nr:ABC transporter permease [Methylobacterium sp. NEAU 140]MDP4026582.1 ABC transporter permease [Methylobacterium sp. NEAU 140]
MAHVGDPRPWRLLLVVPVVASFILFALPQYFFIASSFHENLGYGRIGEAWTLANYHRLFTDRFYIGALVKTVGLSAASTIVCLIIGFPVAYMLARMGTRSKAALSGLLVAAMFVTPVVKDLGLIIILSQSGIVNQTLELLGIITGPIQWLGAEIGVLIGLVHYMLPLIVLLLATVIATVPRSLEDAAHAHGASRARVYYGVIVPIVRPGIIAAALMVFNLAMGAFTTPALLGGGRVLTFAILIQRSVILDVDYPFAASLSSVLLVTVFLLNVLAGFLMVRQAQVRRGRPKRTAPPTSLDPAVPAGATAAVGT